MQHAFYGSSCGPSVVVDMFFGYDSVFSLFSLYLMCVVLYHESHDSLLQVDNEN